jgi:hypothetical protein
LPASKTIIFVPKSLADFRLQLDFGIPLPTYSIRIGKNGEINHLVMGRMDGKMKWGGMVGWMEKCNGMVFEWE